MLAADALLSRDVGETLKEADYEAFIKDTLKQIFATVQLYRIKM